MTGLARMGLAAALISPEMPLRDRQAKLGPFFEPKPGQALLLDPRSMREVKRDDDLTVQGELWVRPPPGQCLIVRRDYEERDRRICKPTPIRWEIYDLDATGNYNLLVIAGPRDEGTWLRWPTPYRVANYIPLGGLETDENLNVTVKDCQTSLVGDQRRITLTLLTGRRWLILLPPVDTPTQKREDSEPNLIVHIDSKAEANKPQAVPGAGNKVVVTEESGEPKKRPSVLAQLLSGGYKSSKKEEFVFRVTRRDAYEMSSSGFTEQAVPQGMTGRCRYKFRGAPGDPDSGVIECFKTDTLDAIYTHVTCFPQFEPRLDPNPPKVEGPPPG